MQPWMLSKLKDTLNRYAAGSIPYEGNSCSLRTRFIHCSTTCKTTWEHRRFFTWCWPWSPFTTCRDAPSQLVTNRGLCKERQRLVKLSSKQKLKQRTLIPGLIMEKDLGLIVQRLMWCVSSREKLRGYQLYLISPKQVSQVFSAFSAASQVCSLRNVNPTR